VAVGGIFSGLGNCYLTNYDDVTKAFKDGRIQTVAAERKACKAYKKALD